MDATKSALASLLPHNACMTLDLYSRGMKGDYHAYLLRLQRRDAQEPWHIRVENAQNGRIHHFVSEKELLGFIISLLNTKDGIKEALEGKD